MSDKYENEKGMYIDVHTDTRGKDHVSFYDGDPSGSHSSIHINWDSETGKGTIVDTTSGEKETTDIGCYLTTACMKYKMQEFNDNCEELTTLRWFRDNYVSKEDINHYYEIAPIIVNAINTFEKNEVIYNYIYENVIIACVNAIKKGDYKFAYDRYKNSVIALEEQYAKPLLKQQFTKILKLKFVK